MKPLTGLKKQLAEKIEAHQRELWNWHMALAQEHAPPFYCSIDLRDSGYKIVPVDSNLYPAGFNNLCPDDLRAAPAVIRAQIDAASARLGHESPKRVLIVPESHTQNKYYIENIYFLKQIFLNAGFDTELGWYAPSDSSTIHLTSASEKILHAQTIKIQNGVLSAGGFTPDLILLNNDFSGGYPKPLDSVTQPILPSHVLGWHSRKKSEHFKYYNQLAKEFADLIDIDPWSIQIDTEEVTPVNFNENEGIEKVALVAEKMLEKIRVDYLKREIEHEPFVFIKNNHGTYGMGIMVVQSKDELLQMNRRTKNKMSIGKNHRSIDSVAIQEGIPTATRFEKKGAAEPVIYLAGAELIGGFLRTHTEKSSKENLNAPGMIFKKFCMSDLRKLDDLEQLGEEVPVKRQPTLELVYGSIARLSALATAMELKAHRGN